MKKIELSKVPVLNFSIAGLYSETENTLRLSHYPTYYAISRISIEVNPFAGDGSLTPGAYSAYTYKFIINFTLTDDKSKFTYKTA